MTLPVIDRTSMGKLWSAARVAAITVVLAVASLACPRPAEAAPPVYAHLTWQGTGGNSVQFTLTVAFLRAQIPFPRPVVGEIFRNPVIAGDVPPELNAGDGTVIGGRQGSNLFFRAMSYD